MHGAGRINELYREGKRRVKEREGGRKERERELIEMRYETSVIVNTEVPNDLPFNDYFEYFSPDFQLIPDPGPIKYDNLNNKPYLDNLKVLKGEGGEEEGGRGWRGAEVR